MSLFLLFALLIAHVLSWRRLLPNSHFLTSTRYHQALWTQWKTHYNKQYDSPAEESMRFRIFLANAHQIANWNHKYQNKTFFSVNGKSDLTPAEFIAKVSSPLSPQNSQDLKRHLVDNHLLQAVHINQSVDWHAAGHVTNPVEQGDCGGCYAFSASSVLESRCSIAGLPLRNLSVQEVIDCTKHWGNHDCLGGNMVNVYRYAHNMNGLCERISYGYHGSGKRRKCENLCQHYNPVKGWGILEAQSEEKLMKALNKGPLAIGIHIDPLIQHYDHGIIEHDCKDDLNHAAVVVGYGQENGVKYWKIKNSWGTDWGEGGFMRICRNCSKNGANGQCGLVKHPPSFPICQI